MNRRAAILSALLAPLAGAARAQAFPSQPLKLVVPYPAGGGADVVARLLAQAAGSLLGQPILVENKPGAGTIVAAEYVARSKSDGYTLMLADSSTMSTNAFLYRKLPYDPQRDLTPITLVTHYPFLLVARNGFPATNLSEVLAQVRQHPGKFTYASGGPGGPHHLAMELFLAETGTQMMHVPYKGAAASIQGLLGGQVDLMFLDLAAGHNFVREGKLRAYGAAHPTRLPKLPEVPTMEEAGMRGFLASTWTGIVAPGATPAPLVTQLNDAFTRALKTPQVETQLAQLGVEPIPSTPAQFAAHARTEASRWGKLIAAKKISLD